MLMLSQKKIINIFLPKMFLYCFIQNFHSCIHLSHVFHVPLYFPNNNHAKVYLHCTHLLPYLKMASQIKTHHCVPYKLNRFFITEFSYFGTFHTLLIIKIDTLKSVFTDSFLDRLFFTKSLKRTNPDR